MTDVNIVRRFEEWKPEKICNFKTRSRLLIEDLNGKEVETIILYDDVALIFLPNDDYALVKKGNRIKKIINNFVKKWLSSYPLKQ